MIKRLTKQIKDLRNSKNKNDRIFIEQLDSSMFYLAAIRNEIQKEDKQDIVGLEGNLEHIEAEIESGYATIGFVPFNLNLESFGIDLKEVFNIDGLDINIDISQLKMPERIVYLRRNKNELELDIKYSSNKFLSDFSFYDLEKVRYVDIQAHLDNEKEYLKPLKK